jgi:hypothetical protein
MASLQRARRAPTAEVDPMPTICTQVSISICVQKLWGKASICLHGLTGDGEPVPANCAVLSSSGHQIGIARDGAASGGMPIYSCVRDPSSISSTASWAASMALTSEALLGMTVGFFLPGVQIITSQPAPGAESARMSSSCPRYLTVLEATGRFLRGGGRRVAEGCPQCKVVERG